MNEYFMDDALDWLRAHVTDAPEDAIARALIEVLDVDDWQAHLEFSLDAALSAQVQS
jgi:L-aminopeptidase/D-esterase-like protein